MSGSLRVCLCDGGVPAGSGTRSTVDSAQGLGDSGGDTRSILVFVADRVTAGRSALLLLLLSSGRVLRVISDIPGWEGCRAGNGIMHYYGSRWCGLFLALLASFGVSVFFWMVEKQRERRQE